MKTIYLLTGKITYNDLSELEDAFKKCNITIGEGCLLGVECRLGDGCLLGAGCKLGDNVKLGNWCKLGNECRLGDKCELGNWCKLGAGCKLGNECRLGDKCELGNWCKLGDNVKLLKSPFYAIGLYKYHMGAYWSDNVAYVQLGCYLKSVDEWERDFWNNTYEFLNHKSKESKRRLYAYKTAKMWLDENKEN